jgi:hypothetical protein
MGRCLSPRGFSNSLLAFKKRSTSHGSVANGITSARLGARAMDFPRFGADAGEMKITAQMIFG